HARVVRATFLTVDVGREGASRRIGDRVLKPRGRGARDEIDERLKVAIAGQRQVLHRLRVQADVDITLRRLQDHAAGLDADLFRDRAEFDGGIDAGDTVDGNVDALLGVRSEPACRYRQVVSTLEQVTNRKVAGVVSGDLPGQARRRVGHGHGRFG